jgi:hypothetical protein
VRCGAPLSEIRVSKVLGRYSAQTLRNSILRVVINPRMVILLFIAAVLPAATAAGCGGGSGADQADKDKAVAAAKFLFAGQAKRDFSSGPCLSESLPGLSDWAVDIAHDPRQPVDDQPANQCQSFREGQTHHFVELTPDGQLIRAD